MAENLPGYRALHPEFRNLFNSYYNAIGDRPLRTCRGRGAQHPQRSHADDSWKELSTWRAIHADLLG